MVTKKEEIQVRKDRVLGVTVEEYIHSVTPVSSSYITEHHFFDLSSATIRNILAELEEDGFLTHPHTSAGRVPTQKGYRYYVDYLMDQIQILENEKAEIKAQYEAQTQELEDLLDQTSKILSDSTHYTSIVSVDGWDRKLYCCGTNFVVQYPEYQDLKKIQDILYALDEKEKLLKVINRELLKRINVFIGSEIKLKEVESCSMVVTQYKTHHGTSGRIAVLGPTRMDYERVVSTLNYVTNLLEECY
ncbi:MAG: hypothetical protein HQL26_02695 [Candidatus Omnitrophica bacterium]|nr:hypothetical protein [Candidatus Omnitrophota bacterium]